MPLPYQEKSSNSTPDCRGFGVIEAFRYECIICGYSTNSPDEKDMLAVSAAPDAGLLADELTRRLGLRDFRIVVPKSREKFLQYGRRLEIPAGFVMSE